MCEVRLHKRWTVKRQLSCPGGCGIRFPLKEERQHPFSKVMVQHGRYLPAFPFDVVVQLCGDSLGVGLVHGVGDGSRVKQQRETSGIQKRLNVLHVRVQDYLSPSGRRR